MTESPSASLSAASGPPLFKAESRSRKPKTKMRPWKLLVVDDEPEVHSVTRLALSDFRYDGRGLEFISAYSGEQAREIIAADPEIAVMLLDVVMETDDAGLRVVQHVRQSLGNNFIRIILRTGHPGLAPERAVIKAYDINDYRAKTELTQDRMFSLMYTSLAAYKRLTTLARSRRHLAALGEEYRGVLDRVAGLLQGPLDTLDAGVTGLRRHEQALPTPEPQLASVAELIGGASKDLRRVGMALQRLSELAELDEPVSEFALGDVMNEVLEYHAERISKAGVHVEIEALPTISGYRGLLRDLLIELFGNAMQFQDGDVEVCVTAQSRGKDWEVSVADRGRGVPADQTESVFHAFSGHTPAGRLGLGLARCRKIVALHGGRIWLEARPGGGSIVKFTLPASGVPYELY